MSTAAQKEFDQLTEEQLLSLPHIGKSEFINGRLIMAPAGFEHGDISAALLVELALHVRARRLGRVLDSSTGFRMKSGNVLSPDVAFVAAARMKGMRRLPRRYFNGAPELAAEVLSPNDQARDVNEKIAEYFENDARLVWIIDPDSQSARIYRDANS